MTETAATSSRLRRSLAGVAAGVVAAAAGLLPWLVGGGRLPLQNLWANETLPGGMPFVLLPVSQYKAITLLVLLVVPAVAAGLAVRATAGRVALPAWSVAAGLLLAHAGATAQSFVVVARGLELGQTVDARVGLYFFGLLGGVVASILLAQAGFLLTSRASRGPAALGLSLVATPLAYWLNEAVAALSGPGQYPAIMSGVVRWLPAVVVGLTLAWYGLRPGRQIAVWAAALAALWVTPALFVSLQYGLGMRILRGDVGEMLSASAQLFPQVLELMVAPVVVALVLGLAAAATRAGLARRGRPGRVAPEGEPARDSA
ncbi:hypothetical protein GCG21_04355 [Pseudactinotalea sp. HY160]|uniref:hypothetical protein n=1 Tax=Pseudactinotalea sp. HY160 TaxID=2654490 RepID=UPI00128C384D|nr:hypothetical protein [Pseudactinotalea sp. HY160]MPV49246.1 hypothetical protein [Pseudactinotalea sp. HY160]